MSTQSNQWANIKGLGPKTIEKLQKLGIYNAQDLLFHLPLRYEDRTRVVPLGHIRPGQHVVVEGTIYLTETQHRNKSSLLCRLSDGTGFLTLRLFHFNYAQKQTLTKGTELRCFGEVRYGQNGYEMIHPEYRKISNENPPPVEQYLTPVYPTTEGLHQFALRKLISQLLQQDKKELLFELLPKEILDQLNLPPLEVALSALHQPPKNTDINTIIMGKDPCTQRLAFEELLAHRLSLNQLREQKKQVESIKLPLKGHFVHPFLQQLPFSLTQAQLNTVQEIQKDINQSTPMLRLLQGDVGSGKTVVAALAALTALENNQQVALMAPTELLAEQHLTTFQKWLEPLNLTVTGLTGNIKGKARRERLKQIAEGEAKVVVGTHALFQENVEFNQLALIIVDEQHRFGVNQRLLLRKKGIQNPFHPHQLIMTATPIPRTLAMVAYADLDCSTIDELPPGRLPVKTSAINNNKRTEIIEHIKKLCLNKKQIYWVCTLIEESDLLQCQAAENTLIELKKTLPTLRIGLVHGRMPAKKKDQIMLAFKSGEYDILVSTTVIEVGIDVPNANLIIIENAERLGLSQLHQLRGRVGRNQIENHCVLLYQSPLSTIAKQRLDIMRQTNDGFIIAKKDLELRGPGEVLGTKQTGLVSMRIADLMRDQSLLPQIQDIAKTIHREYPEIIQPIINRWITCSGQYGTV